MKRLAVLLAGLALAGCGGGVAVTSSAPSSAPPVQAKAVSNLTAFMGDSITAYWNLPAYDPNPTLNFGVPGNTTVQMLARFGAVLAAQPGVVVIMGGYNDMFGKGIAGANTDSIAAMAVQARAAGILVIIGSMTPANFQVPPPQGFGLPDIEEFNQELISLAQSNGYLYADYYDQFLNPDGSINMSLFTDGLHPTDAGYALMWKVIEPLLNEDLH